jgi:AAHS family 4-hydroxybenzoate transporter-like MFS transporter
LRDHANEQIEGIVHYALLHAKPVGLARVTTGRRVLSLVLLGGVFVLDGYDIAAMALAVPRLDAALGLPATSFAWVFSAILVGLGIGGAVIAPFGDRVGRRPLIVFGFVAVAVFTMATSTATSVTEFLIWRLLTGLAFGAVLPNVSALSAELAPDRLRATLMALVSAGIPLGIALAGLLAPQVVGFGGWQGLFVVPGLMAAALSLVLGYVLAGGVPESQSAAPASRLPQLELFRAPWLLPFGVFAAILSLNAMNIYYLTSWAPTVLPLAGFSQELSDRVFGIVQLAGLAIGMAASIGIDRWRPGATLVVTFAAMTASFIGVSVTAPEPLRWTLLLMVGMGAASAGGMALPALCAYLFPPRLLSSAIGMGVMIARIGAIAGPPIGALMIGAGVSSRLYFAAAAVPAALCALAALAVPLALAVRRRVEAAR